MSDSANLSELWQGWKPPDALRRSCPREVSLTRAGIALLVTCGLLMAGGVAVGIAIGAKAKRESANARLLREQGVDSQAEVTRLWIASDGKDRQHRVAYRFTGDDGSTHKSSASVRQSFWKTLAVGAFLPVRYVPSKPGIHYLKVNGPRRTPAWVPYAVGAPMMLAGLLLPLTIQRQKRLLADGRPAPGVITRYRRTQTNHGAQTWISYEFQLLGGGVRKGRASVDRRIGAEGSVICILYDPDNPRRNAPYPMGLVKVATL